MHGKTPVLDLDVWEHTTTWSSRTSVPTASIRSSTLWTGKKSGVATKPLSPKSHASWARYKPFTSPKTAH